MRLIAIDQLTGVRQMFELTRDARLSDELMRLFPEKISGPWTLYARTVHKDRELTPQQMIDQRVKKGDVYILLMRPGTGVELAWYWQVAIAVLLAATSYLLTPKPRRPNASPSEQAESGTSALAGQSNVLRPGARVPDILGRVRSFPDLLTYPIEIWSRRIQYIEQWFVIGVGGYTLSDYKLSDTSLDLVTGLSIEPYLPGTTTVPMLCVKVSPTVNGISLNAQDGGVIPPVANVTFAAGPKTMSAPSIITLTDETPVTIAGTFNNNANFFVVDIPPTDQTTGPFVYTLVGPVANEASANPAITPWLASTAQNWVVDMNQPPYGVNQIWIAQETYVFAAGDAVRIAYGGSVWYGICAGVSYVYAGETVEYTILSILDMYGAPITFPSVTFATIHITSWVNPPSLLSAADGPTPTAAEDNTPTDWQVSSIADPDELWVDIAFPQGLSKFNSGNREPLRVDIRIEFRRGLSGAAQATVVKSYYEAVSAMLRYTERFVVAALGLPAGSDPIHVRVTRVTEVYPDSSTVQYVQDAVWQRFSAVRILPPRTYPGVTIVRLGLTNSRSASSVGQNTFNCVATRILPTGWNGSTWTSNGPTEKWADNLIARIQAQDGAAKDNTDIDLAGIYALQGQLDLLDGGAQGEIGLALDQLQDIDAELAQIADVVRAQVYRVGRKVHVIRDQETSQRIALFNGRAKSSDAEAVGLRMKASDENDAVIVSWMDEAAGWKQREYQYPPEPIVYATNPLRVGTLCANWAQTYRRARYEWARLLYRRETLTCPVTEDGRICRPGDVVNMTDDVANLAAAAGEVLYVSGNVLTLDRDVTFGPAGNTLLVRDVHGQKVDAIPVTAVAGSPNRVTLTRAPIAGVTIKPRDETLGTLFAFYHDSAAIVRPWLLTGVEVAGPYVQLSGVNYTPRVYEGDSVTLPAQPAIGETTP